MKTLYNFVKYDMPKNGLFAIETNVYDIKIGWVQKETEYLIIGETNDSYVYELIHCINNDRTYEVGEIDEDGLKINEEYLLPLGVHKSRLLKWIPTQILINL